MKKIFFIVAIIFVLLFLFVLYLFISNIRRTPEEIVKEIPVPTESQIKPPAASPPIIEEEPLIEQIITRLPVSTETYNIEYLSSSNTFIITVKQSPFKENSEDALRWFLENGFKNTEGLNIIYNSYKWVE